MRGDASPESGNHAALNAVPAFQHGNHPSLAVRVRDLAQLFREPLVVRFFHAQVHGALDFILGVRVEAGGDENQIGLKRGDGGQGFTPPHAAPRRASVGPFAKTLHAHVHDPRQRALRGAVAGGLRDGKRVIHDAFFGPNRLFFGAQIGQVSVIRGGPASGVKVHAFPSLAVAVHGGKKHLLVVGFVQPRAVRRHHDCAVAVGRGKLKLRRRGGGVLHHRLSAVAVVHVKVDDRHSAKRVPVHAPRVRRAEGDVVQQTETVRARAWRVTWCGYRAVGAGVVSRGTHGAENLLRGTRDHAVHRFHHGARRAKRRAERVVAHLGVSVDRA